MMAMDQPPPSDLPARRSTRLRGFDNLPKDGPSGKGRVGQFVAPSVGLGAIVRGVKSAVTAAARKERAGVGPVGQRGYHDRIIRIEAELERFRRYIADNPRQWELDRYCEREAGEASS
jgi:hypothetical protein